MASAMRAADERLTVRDGGLSAPRLVLRRGAQAVLLLAVGVAVNGGELREIVGGCDPSDRCRGRP